MKAEKRILLPLLLIVVLILVLAPFSQGRILPSDEHIEDNAEWVPRRMVGAINSPTFLGDSATSPVVDLVPLNGSPYPVRNLNTSENFSLIQEAIDALNTTDGHIIEVDPGNYSENIKVNKSLTIQSSSGDPITTIVQAANTSKHVFTVTADNVTIRGFSIEGAFDDGVAGIYLASSYNRITNNILTANYYGVIAVNSTGNLISDNHAELNDDTGIYLESYSNNNLIDNNTASLNLFGILLYEGCEDNIITNNTLDSNLYEGISLGNCNDNIVTDNTASSYHFWSGISLWGSSANNTITYTNATANAGGGIVLWDYSLSNTIKNNSAHSNGGVGIALFDFALKNSIENNTLNHNAYSGIQLSDYTNNNTLMNNSASFNDVSGIALFDSCSDNRISHNELSSNNYGLSIVSSEGNASNNTIITNTLSYNKGQGIWIRNLQYPNTIKNNAVLHNLIFGIGISQSTNLSIESNTANFNELGIGLLLCNDIQLIDNAADSNKITGFYLWESYNNTIVNNTANLNQFEGVYLINSSFNEISTNTLASSYFGIYLDTASNNTIADNDAVSNYYTEVFLYASPGNTLINNTWYIQEAIIYGVSLSVPEIITPSLQVVDNGTNATYSLMVANLGNTPDTIDLTILSGDDPATLFLEPDTVSLGPGEIDFETIKLHVGDTEPGIYRATVAARSRGEPTVKDSIGTRTIVRGEVDSEYVTSTVEDSALITSSITDSSISRSAIINSTISGSTITDSMISNSVVVGTTLHDVTVANALVTDGVISTGTITIKGITYEINGEERIADLVIGSDYSDSNLVGIKNSKTLTVIAEDSDVDFDISAKGDYFAGSMRVQKATIPPNGVPELTNAVSGYVCERQ